MLGHQSMKLTFEQLTQYRNDGYTTVPDFFDKKEVAAMQAELQRLKDDGLLNNVARLGDGQTKSATVISLQICPLAPKSDFFRSLGFADKVIAVI
jgi:hypothetical protein